MCSCTSSQVQLLGSQYDLSQISALKSIIWANKKKEFFYKIKQEYNFFKKFKKDQNMIQLRKN